MRCASGTRANATALGSLTHYDLKRTRDAAGVPWSHDTFEREADRSEASFAGGPRVRAAGHPSAAGTSAFGVSRRCQRGLLSASAGWTTTLTTPWAAKRSHREASLALGRRKGDTSWS